MSKMAPQIRFQGFTDDWEERKLDTIFKKVRNAFVGTATPYYVDNGNFYLESNNVKNGQINRDTEVFINDEFYNKQADKLLHTGDIVMVQSGHVGHTAVIPPELDGTAAHALIMFTDYKNSTDPFFLNYQFQTHKAKRKLDTITTGNTIKHILSSEMKEFFVDYPSFEEQEKIGSFFKQLDNAIALHQSMLDLLKEQKKGFLQKMFPKNGAKVPELRFSGFADDWEERKLSSMTNYKNGKGHENKQSTSGKLELINLNSISISGGLKHSGKFIDEADDTLQKDDLVMILSDVGHGDLLGRVALIPEDDRFVLNQRVALLRPNITADPQFLFSYINAHQYYFKAQGAGMSQLNISKGSVENFISFVPIVEEQQKIGSFFKQLDDTIALHQRKLNLLTEQKKGFLQKMFVS